MADVHCVIIDTNVLAVAERMHDGATDECVLACVRLVHRVNDGQAVGVDTGDAILTEYLGALRGSTESGVGKKLALFLWHRRHDSSVCHQLPITPLDDPAGSFAEVPTDLRDFDIDDQKFLAVAAAEGLTPPIFQALDEEWWRRRPDFAASGLDVQFLCVADII
jgi:hypothetical protein